MKRITHIGLSLIALAALSACGSNSSEPMSSVSAGGSSSLPDGGVRFPSTPLSTFASASKTFTVTLKTAPNQPPKVGEGEAELSIVDSSGQPVDGLSVVVAPWAPVMGHGSPQGTTVTEQGDGVYLVEKLDPTMPGLWDVEIRTSGTMSDKATSPTFTVAE